MTRDAAIVRAVHEYGRARSQSDYMLERVDIPSTEAKRRIARTGAAWDRIVERITPALRAAGIDIVPPIVSALAEVGVQLWHYGTMRQEGADAGAAVDVLEAIDELLAIAAATPRVDGE